ncbi:MAG: hypothetical protein ABH817_02645 [archaeon]
MIKSQINSLKNVLENVIAKKIDLTDFNPKKVSFDFKEKQKEYYSKEIDSKLNNIRVIINREISTNPRDTTNLKRILDLIDNISKLLLNKGTPNLREVIKLLVHAQEFAPKNITPERTTEFELPNLPEEIKKEARANFEELKTCFENKCYRSVLILCGTLLEISLHRKYFDLTKIDLLEKAPDLGLGKLILKLREKGFEFDPGISQQIHLINQLRVYTVHKKHQVFTPSHAQANACILYTLDILKKIFRS